MSAEQQPHVHGTSSSTEPAAPPDESPAPDEPAAPDGPGARVEPLAANEPAAREELAAVDGPVPPPDEPCAVDERVALPDAVRLRVVALAAERVGALPPDQVPAPLRAVARFTPAKRARLGALPLAAALESDEEFRERIAEGLREGGVAV